jgi:hypothetical protein
MKTSEGAAPALDGVIARIADRGRRLDLLDDQLGELIKRAEDALAGHLSVRVSVQLPTTESDDPSHMTFVELLVFGKENGRWQLLLEDGPDDGDPDLWRATPLSSAPRDRRAQMFAEGWIEKLLDAALAHLDREIAERESALAKAESLTSTLERSATKPARKGGSR